LAHPAAEDSLAFLHHSLTLLLERSLEARSLAEETLERYREINLLYNIGETISASLDPDEIPDLVMAERGASSARTAASCCCSTKNARWSSAPGSAVKSSCAPASRHPRPVGECLESGEPQSGRRINWMSTIPSSPPCSRRRSRRVKTSWLRATGA
jgi:hypothetical protein